MSKCVQPEWCTKLSLQQQSVLFLAARGPDGIAKAHPCKPIQVAYRACVLVAARYGRMLAWGEKADTFMSLEVFANDVHWADAVTAFFQHVDELPHHYVMHLMHGVQILGYKHPEVRFRAKWGALYDRMVEDLHLHPESEVEMDARLGDWGQRHWQHDGVTVPTYTCEHCGVASPKDAWGPGRVVCPKCKKHAPSAAESAA